METITRILLRILSYLGYVIRTEGIETLFFEGKVNTENSRPVGQMHFVKVLAEISVNVLEKRKIGIAGATFYNERSSTLCEDIPQRMARLDDNDFFFILAVKI